MFAFQSFTLVLAITACVLAIGKHSYKYIQTSRGPRTITKVQKSIQADQNSVYRTLCDYNSWTKWISPSSSFTCASGSELLKIKGDYCDEIFGFQGSSRIRWMVREIIPETLFTVYSSESEGTFGWDELEMSFQLQADAKDITNLEFTYSWTVPNPVVSVIEKLFVRQSMINDNEVALNKLAELCKSYSVGL